MAPLLDEPSPNPSKSNPSSNIVDISPLTRPPSNNSTNYSKPIINRTPKSYSTNNNFNNSFNNIQSNSKPPTTNNNHFDSSSPFKLSHIDERKLDQVPVARSSPKSSSKSNLKNREFSNTKLLTMLAHLIEEGASIEKIKNFIQERNIRNLNDWDEHGIPPLFRAMYAGKEDLIEELIDLGADVNFKTQKGIFLLKNILLSSVFLGTVSIFFNEF